MVLHSTSCRAPGERRPERPVLPTSAIGRTSRLLGLPVRHVARTVAKGTRISSATAEQLSARGAEQLFTTLGELKGGPAKLGQALSVFESALPDEVARPYRSALTRLTDATPAMPSSMALRVLADDLSSVYGMNWTQRLVDFDETPSAAASIGQVHRGRWRDERGAVVDVAVKIQYPGVAKALRSDLRTARLVGRVMARMTGLDIGALTEELAARIVDELDYVREGRVQREVGAAFGRRLPAALSTARAAGAREPAGRTGVVVPQVYTATPRVLITSWLDGAPLMALVDPAVGRLPAGWRELDRGAAADLAGRLIGHAMYAPAACTGWMHADPHPGNFVLMADQRLGLLDFGSVARLPSGPPEPLGHLAVALLAGDGSAALRWARQAGALAPDAVIDPGELTELLYPVVAPSAGDSFTYSAAWLRELMRHLAQPRFAATRRQLSAPLEYALLWRGVLSIGGLYAQLGATVPTRAFELAYSPGFRKATTNRTEMRTP